MEFDIEKRDILIMRNGKRQIMEEIELPNQEKIEKFGKKETFMSLGIFNREGKKNFSVKQKPSRNQSL